MITLTDSLATHGPTPPIGLAYIAATLREGGHRVTVIDAAGEGITQVHRIDTPVGALSATGLHIDEVVGRVPADTQMIGVTVMFLHEWPHVRDMLGRLRSEFPAATIVLGGETPTAFWPRILEECPAVDVVVLGEGERTALELAQRLASGRSLQDLEGTVVRSPGLDGPVDHGLPTRERALGQVPRPAWDLFPIENYWRHPYFGVDRGRSMPVMATRGCPYKCTFCSSPQMWTTSYVTRPPADVVDEIEEHVVRHAVRNINFCDLTAITRRRWTLEFCDELESRGLDITWQLPVGTRAEALDEEVLLRMVRTGCRNVTYAPESGSPRMLEVYDKRVDLEQILSSIRAASRTGLRTHCNIIVGHPQERLRDVVLSIRFLLRAALAGCDDAAVIIFCPYPGSVDFDRLVERGALEIDERTCYVALTRSSNRATSYNTRFSARQLRLLQLSMMGVFYATALAVRPRRIVQFVRSVLGGAELTYLDQMVRTRRQARRPAEVGHAPAPDPIVQLDLVAPVDRAGTSAAAGS